MPAFARSGHSHSDKIENLKGRKRPGGLTLLIRTTQLSPHGLFFILTSGCQRLTEFAYTRGVDRADQRGAVDMPNAGRDRSLSREFTYPLREDPFFARRRRQACMHRVAIRRARGINIREQECVTLCANVREPDPGEVRFSP